MRHVLERLEMYTEFQWGNLNGRLNMGDLDVEGNVNLVKNRMGLGWIRLARNRDHCRTLVRTIMNLRLQLKTGNFLRS
jgi:hypothetical protein